MKSMIPVPDLLKIILITASILCNYVAVAELDNVTTSDFFAACSEGNHKIVGYLIQSNPELVSLQDENRVTCLMMAGVPWNEDDPDPEREPVNMIKLLVEAGADVNQRSNEENYPMPVLGLHVMDFNFKTVEYLLKEGADVNIEFDGTHAKTHMKGISTPLDMFHYSAGDDFDDDRMPQSLRDSMVKTLKVLEKFNALRYSAKKVAVKFAEAKVLTEEKVVGTEEL